MVTPEITSTANPRVKAWRALRDRSERDRTRTFVVEGLRETVRAAATLSVEATILTPERADLDLPAPIVVSHAVFEALSVRRKPDGVAAIVRTPDHSLERFPSDADLVLVADGVQKPGNIGAMLRTADAMGAGFIGASLATDLVNPNVVRSAQGSLFTTPIAIGARADVIAWCAGRFAVVVATPDATELLWDVDMAGPTAIVVGSEHDGVDAAWLPAGRAARIPTTGVADSLNVSVAGALFLVEARRQRAA